MVSCTACQKVGRGIACCQAQHGKRSGGILHVVMHSMVKFRDGYCMLSCAAWEKIGRDTACCHAPHGKKSVWIVHVIEMEGERGNLV